MTVLDLPKTWHTCRLGSAPVTFVDGDRSEKYPKRTEFVGEGVPFLNAESISNGRLDASKANFITGTKFAEIKKGRLVSGDLILTTRGNGVGKPAFYTSTLPALINAQLLIIRPDRHKLEPGFLYYSFCDPSFQSQLQNFTTGSAQPQLPITTLRELEFKFPPLPAQCKIASILSAYDDLIENNTRRIAILEAMAQAIYREWFVEFRFPGHENVKLVDSPLGKIPEGWKPQTLGSVLEFHIGGGWGQDSADDEYANPAFVIRGTDIPEARTLRVVDCPKRYHTASNIRTRKLRANDLIFEVSGGSKGQPVGRCLFVSERLLRRFDGDVICASFCKLIRANPLLLAPELLYHFLAESYTNGIIEQYEVQSTGIKNFKFTVFLDSESIAVPPTDVQERFVSQVRPILDTVHTLGKKNEILRNTRDLLLPKLITGQVDVEDLDIDTGEAVTE